VPRKIIQGPQGQRYSVTQATFDATYQPLGYAIIADEPDPTPASPAAFLIHPDDLGAWDTGPLYLIAHPDGRRYGVTYANFVHYYEPLGFALVAAERVTDSRFVALLDHTGAALTDSAGNRLLGV
jgi:hypothetical protein